MTRFWPYMFGLLLAWPFAAVAQTVEVRSGEHETFTRLVFNLPERLDVALQYQSDGVMLSFGRDGLVFDTDTVFDRVPTTRLTAMNADDSTMILALACKCEVNTFWAGERSYVVDIADETAISAALFPTLGEDTSPDIPESQPVPETDQTVMPQRQSGIESFVLGSRDAGSLSVGSIAFLIADAQDRLDQMRKESSDDMSSYVNTVRQSQDEIVEQIGRAATQGLLSPREDLMPYLPATEVESVDVAPSSTSMADIATGEDFGLGQNVTLNAQTSVDQALSNRINLAFARAQGTGCIARARIDVASWAGGERFVDQIGTLRSKILGEFDQPSNSDILKLVRFYIHFGFGVEARQVANMLPSNTSLAPELDAMIRILDRGHDEPNSVFEGQMDCDPLAAVWSLLSYDTVPGNQPIDPDGIVRGVLELPTHLRAYLGPIVGQKLQRGGYVRAADHVARTLVRNKDTETASAQYLFASSGDAAQETYLGAVVANNAEPAPEALLELVERRLQAGQPTSGDLAILAGAYAMEYRNAPIGPDLTRAYLLSLASAGNFSESFAEFSRLTQAGPAPTASTMSEMMALLAREAPNPTFLTQSISADQATRFALDDEVGNAVANRLIKLGFPQAAERFVAPMAIGEAERARKLLRAEVALQQSLPRKAELELVGEEGEDVTQLLARARSMAGEHGSAQQMYVGIDEQDEALRQAWLDSDWQILKAHSDPAIAAIATRQAAPDTDGETDVSQVLARNNAMLEDSRSMRADIQALLSGITIPEALSDEAQ